MEAAALRGALSRYGLKPFREAGRRSTTVQVRAPKAFHARTLWPEYLALAAELDAHLRELTERVIREAIHEDVTEAPEAATKALSAGAGAPSVEASEDERAEG